MKKQSIVIIETNIDNMNPELYPSVLERLMQAGALDAYLTPIIGKKGRPAMKLTLSCLKKQLSRVTEVVFRETTTIGLRITQADMHMLEREIKTLKTPYGDVRVKYSYLNGKIENATPEYEDCLRIARERKLPLKKIIDQVKKIVN
ncbi:DUF111 family protein [Candidatus Woesearchaeota archaeon]|nr:DUF111 family protein [Candidatus Woesearchaeota archaeon]